MCYFDLEGVDTKKGLKKELRYEPQNLRSQTFEIDLTKPMRLRSKVAKPQIPIMTITVTAERWVEFHDLEAGDGMCIPVAAY